jgi:hypothetical protein
MTAARCRRPAPPARRAASRRYAEPSHPTAVGSKVLSYVQWLWGMQRHQLLFAEEAAAACSRGGGLHNSPPTTSSCAAQRDQHQQPAGSWVPLPPPRKQQQQQGQQQQAAGAAAGASQTGATRGGRVMSVGRPWGGRPRKSKFRTFFATSADVSGCQGTSLPCKCSEVAGGFPGRSCGVCWA